MAEQPSLFKRIDNTHVPMLAARLILGCVFIYMADAKIDDPIKFLKDIHEFHLLPEEPSYLLNVAAVSIPWIEVLCGLLLIAGIWLRGAGFTLLVMLLAFSAAIFLRAMNIHGAGNIAFCDIAFDCGCGAGPINTCLKLSENFGLIALAVITTLSGSRFLALQQLPGTTNTK